MRRRDFLALTTAGLAVPSLLRAAEEPVPLRILFFGGDLPEVRKALEAEYAVTALKGGRSPKKTDQDDDNIEGLEQLADADIWLGSASKRTHPSEAQLAHFKQFLAAGKPFVGYRAASHVFQNWLASDAEVFGAHYGGHHLLGKEKELVIRPADKALEHPILKGLEPPPPVSGSYNYTELADDVTVLLRSGKPGDMMPHTWVRENAKTKGRVFYTRYDRKELADNEVCRTIFVRGVLWALNRDPGRHRRKG